MKFFIALILSLPCLSIADQTDPRLPDWFEQLAASDNPIQTQVLQTRIWGAWSRTDNDVAQAFLDVGTAAMQRGALPLALDRFNQVVKLAPKFAEGWNKRATALFMLQRYDESMADIARTLELEPNHFGALAGLGQIFELRGQFSRALAVYQRIDAIAPSMVGIKDKIQRLEQQMGRSTT